MSASDNTRMVDSHIQTRIIPGSFDKNEDTEYTPYMAQLVEENEAPLWDNFLAGLFSWLTLAGYVVFPSTFTSLKTSKTLANSNTGRVVQDAVKRVSVFIIAAVCCGIGSLGTGYLWWIWRLNAVWLVRHIFLPGLLHSLVGLITTLVNVYTAQGGHWSNTAKMTIIIISVCTGNMSLLYLVYDRWILEKMKTTLDRALAKPRRA